MRDLAKTVELELYPVRWLQHGQVNLIALVEHVWDPKLVGVIIFFCF